MQTTIDSGGRIVLPKPLRDALGLTPGQRVEIRLEGSALRVTAVMEPSGVCVVEGVLVAGESATAPPALGIDEHRQLLERVRQRRR